MVVGGHIEAGGLDLGDGSAVRADAHSGGSELAFHEVADVSDRVVVGVGDDRLGAGIGDAPQDAGRLRDREREVETGYCLLPRRPVDQVGAAELLAGDRGWRP